MNIAIVIFWAIILLTYVLLLVKHHKLSRQTLSHLTVRPTIAKISGVSLNIKESIEDINCFINKLNEYNKETNVQQLRSYWVASVAALIGLLLSVQAL